MWTLVQCFGHLCVFSFLTLILTCCRRLFIWIVWWLLLLKSGLQCVFTLPLFSPTPLGPRSFVPLSGDGDEEHALLSHGVCQEWGDLRWVIFSSTRPVWRQYLKNFVPPSSFTFSPYQLHRKICTVASVVFLTNKEVSMFALLLHLSQPQSQRSHDWWIPENTVLTWPVSCAAGNCCVKCADFAFLLYKLTSLMAYEGLREAGGGEDWFITTCGAESQLTGLLLGCKTSQVLSTWALHGT